jgi:hypothetical protein
MRPMRRLVPCLLLVAPALAACAGAPLPAPPPARVVVVPEPPPAAAEPLPALPPCLMDVERLVAEELRARPLAGDADLYLLLREAILGPEPIVDPAAARVALGLDLDRAGDRRGAEPIVEDLDEVQGTVRLNLRRWRFVRGSANELWPVVEKSARAAGRGDAARLHGCLGAAAAVLPGLGRDAAAFRAYVDARAAEAFPAVEHAPAYRAAYAPAYRVVLRRFLPPWVTAPPPEAG